MKQIDVKTIMDILESERDMEFKCAIKCRELMSKTLNPIKLIKLKSDSKRFMDHVMGINLVIHKIEREIGDA